MTNSKCSKCCKKFGRFLGKCCKKIGKFFVLVGLSIASGFYGCTRRKAIINHMPAVLFFHIFPLVFSILSAVSAFVNYKFLFSSGDSIPAPVLSHWNLFRRWSMSASALLMTAFALNVSVHLYIVRDEYKKPSLYRPILLSSSSSSNHLMLFFSHLLLFASQNSLYRVPDLFSDHSRRGNCCYFPWMFVSLFIHMILLYMCASRCSSNLFFS